MADEKFLQYIVNKSGQALAQVNVSEVQVSNGEFDVMIPFNGGLFPNHSKAYLTYTGNRANLTSGEIVVRKFLESNMEEIANQTLTWEDFKNNADDFILIRNANYSVEKVFYKIVVSIPFVES